MKRGEEIKQKAYEISQRYFPDSQNIWARQNIEAQLVQSACCEIVKFADRTMVSKVRDWLQCIDFEVEYFTTDSDGYTFFDADKFIEEFCKKMEE